MKSWKTTAAGIAGFLAVLAPNVQSVLDNDPATVANWGAVIAALTVAIGLFFARDKDVSSEQEGIK